MTPKDTGAADGLGDLAVVARDTEAERVLSAVRSNLFVSAEPAKLGRFLVIGRLGSGANGVVYSAYDPQLDRKVAIKLLRYGGSLESRRRKRMVREAKAMARLKSPHVVAVHELGNSERDELFIVMELVEGTNLSRWLDRRTGARNDREVLSVMLKAGDGLAAAHRAGLVHRDFKPDNVLIGDDGSVRVADFGLATLYDSAAPSSDSLPAAASEAADADAADAEAAAIAVPDETEITRTGAIIGTPMYMAPEVLAGEPSDATSDQFSFCVTLYEVLCGQAPYLGDSVPELLAAMTAGQLQAAPAGAVEPSLWRILVRGLSADRTQRYNSMAELLQDIERQRDHRRSRWLAAAAGILVLGLLAWVAFRPGPATAPAAHCTGAPAALAPTWNDDRRQQLKQALLAQQHPNSADAFERTDAGLAAYASDWIATHRDVCLATHERGEQSDATLSLRMRCLARRRLELDALVTVFSQADDGVIKHAVQAVAKLTPIDVCNDLDRLGRTDSVPEDPRVAAEVEALRRRLTLAEQQTNAGQFTPATAQAKQVLEEAQVLHYEPFIAHARFVYGDLQLRNGDHAAALESLRLAFSEGLASGNDEVAALAAIRATGLVGFRQHKPKDGHRWAWLAGTVLARIGENVRLEAALVTNRGKVYFAENDLDEAAALFQQAIRLHIRANGPEHVTLGFAHMNLGAARRKQGRLDDSLNELRLAETILSKNLGKSHPDVGRVLNSLGNLYWAREDYVAAERYHRRALALKASSLPAGHPSIAHSCNNLADVLVEQRRFEEAQTLYQRAADLWQAAHGRQHHLVALAGRGVGACQVQRGQHARAEATLEPVLQAQDRLGVKGSERALTSYWLGRALWPQPGKRKRALQQVERARDTLREANDQRGLQRVEAWLDTPQP